MYSPQLVAETGKNTIASFAMNHFFSNFFISISSNNLPGITYFHLVRCTGLSAELFFHFEYVIKVSVRQINQVVAG